MARTIILSSIIAGVASAAQAHGLFLERTTVSAPQVPPSGAGVPLESFVTYSIEFSSFPDFTGNISHPNNFSNNLLNNLADLQGTKPYIRVGGNTQDYAIFDKSLSVPSIGIINPNISSDYPTTLTIGPKYFESYRTWPNVKFVHGFNLGRNSSVARQALLDSVSYACEALQDRLLFWELSNEPDLYKTSAQGPVRPANWTEQIYVSEWHRWTRAIRQEMEHACPQLATDEAFQFYAPSFSGTTNNLDPLRTWRAGLNEDGIVGVISSHNYISGAASPGVTLQRTLMNHSSTVASVAKHINSSRLIHELEPDLPYILGEANSLYNQGRPGLSNTFGAALWGVDFNLWCASNNIQRVHMHMGTNYRYQAWQPIDTDRVAKGTKAPYYGSITVAAFLGNIPNDPPTIVNIPIPHDTEAAYAAYVSNQLERIIIINMQTYNATDYNEEYISNYTRPVEEYAFQLPEGYEGRNVSLQRLLANGSDAISGATFDGYSYDYELDNGKPVLLENVTRGEEIIVGEDGVVRVGVVRSSAVILRL
ncbi:Putative glycoside hydrolase superfamily, beta-glucuronidase [Septoria linicola]|uniref:Glycoside hydrolase superfamily, beta-glucuronidase n=1 Tax=Septoria linicola TaxID=215465 RepID=A0A9Q9EQF0_9PEZI|nr:putative glycoside hydrolase superfamily, beta-glucuronidase [Septoria linicola]USW57483.1 Putative glycoside hydrolase superfamily, beta-glucuronidase [Septoria linicola]